MYFLFQRVFDEDPQAYIQAKLEAVHQGGMARPDMTGSARTALGHIDHPDLRIVDPSDHPPVPADQAAELEVMIRCARHEASMEIPRLSGEIVEADEFSYLAAPFGEHPAGTAVLKRRTNRAELVIFFDELRIEGGRFVRDDAYFEHHPPSQGPLRVGTKAFVIDDLALEAAMAIGKALASKIGQKIGDMFVEQFFPPEPPSYFSKVYKDLTALFKQEIDGAVISTIDGRITGFRQWIADVYEPMHAAGRDPKDLLRQLDDWQMKFSSEVLGPLQEERFRRAGLPVFQLAGSVVLLLDTLAAEVDAGPDGDVAKSSYTKTRALHATRFVNHVDATYKTMVKEIGDSVEVIDNTVHNAGSEVCTQFGCHTAKGTDIPQFDVHDRWADTHTGNYMDQKNGPSARAQADAKRGEILKPRYDTARKAIGGFDPDHPDDTVGPIGGDWRAIAGYAPGG